MSDTLFDDLYAPTLAADAVQQLGVGTTEEPPAPESDEPVRGAATQARLVKQQLLLILRVCGALTRPQLYRRYRAEYGEATLESFLEARFRELLDAQHVHQVGTRRPWRVDVPLWAAKETR